MHGNRYLFTSKRLGFRLPEDADLKDLKRLDMDPEVRAHFPEGVLTVEQILERLRKNQAFFDEVGLADFAAIELATGEFAGRAGFGRIEGGDIEVGYVFLREFWGRGLAQESLRALLGWLGDEQKVARVLAYAPVQHTASFNVMKKSGMRYLETRNLRGVECDVYEFAF